MKKIGLLGPKGTFCDLAYKTYCEQLLKEESVPIYYNTIKKVAQGIVDNDLTILPLENCLDGYVQETLDIILEHPCHIICTIVVPINFAFISFEKEIKNIKSVYAQYKSAGQCTEFIYANEFNVIATENNVASLNYCLNQKSTTSAIIPTHLLKGIQPALVIEDIMDKTNNYTRFIVLSHNPHYEDKKAKCSMWIYANDDHPGMLSTALDVFHLYRINLTCIMSRPTKDQLGTYNFYVEFDVDENNIQLVNKVVEAIEASHQFNVKVSGIYSNINLT